MWLPPLRYRTTRSVIRYGRMVLCARVSVAVISSNKTAFEGVHFPRGTTGSYSVPVGVGHGCGRHLRAARGSQVGKQAVPLNSAVLPFESADWRLVVGNDNDMACIKLSWQLEFYISKCKNTSAERYEPLLSLKQTYTLLVSCSIHISTHRSLAGECIGNPI